MYSDYLINAFGVTVILALMAFGIIIIYKAEKIKQLRSEVNNLKKSLDEMDEQAKLIVRTDIELNKTQEELDKKVLGLYALQRLSRAISTSLEENQIFKMIDPAYLEELGFEKACSFLWDDSGNLFLPMISVGYPPDAVAGLKSFAGSDKSKFLGLIKNQRTLSSMHAQSDGDFIAKIKHSFKVESFIISPLLPKEGSKGFLFVGTANLETIINEGDEELINILANQLGQALENARLFEKTWRAQQDLEKKVEARTHELTKALDEVKIINNRKSEFVSSVSHELRTPLTSIKGYAAILLTEKLGGVPPEIRERLEKINRHSDELVHLVNDLLDISRIESRTVIMKKEELELKNIIAKVSDLLCEQLKEKEIDFGFDVSEDANLILADRSQIERVFINLINNALKFTPQKGRISVKTRTLDNTIEVDIADTGCGIPEEAQEKIFEEFFRVDNAINQEVKGTGLGLALVKGIVQAHNGKIWVKSKPGAGSTFSFALPKPVKDGL